MTGSTRSSGAVALLRPRSLGRRAEPRWVRVYTGSLVALETVTAAVAGGAVLLGRSPSFDVSTPLFWAAAALVIAWPALLGATGAYSERVYGTGSDEYLRVGKAGFLLLALASFLSYIAALDLSRMFVVVAIPALTAVGLFGRYAARIQLRRRRAHGRCTKRVVVVGRGERQDVVQTPDGEPGLLGDARPVGRRDAGRDDVQAGVLLTLQAAGAPSGSSWWAGAAPSSSSPDASSASTTPGSASSLPA